MKNLLAGLVLIVGGALGAAQASTIDFILGETTITPESGISADYAYTSKTLGNTFSLAAGETQHFDLFEISCQNELCGGVGTFSASLDFLAPAGTGSADGTAFAFGFTLFNWTIGTLEWMTDAVTLFTPNGDEFLVSFNDIGFTLRNSGSVMVSAAITAVSVAPLPGAAVLFATALLGAGAMRRRQSSRRALDLAAA